MSALPLKAARALHQANVAVGLINGRRGQRMLDLGQCNLTLAYIDLCGAP